jgi:hypothetical protein
VARSEGPGARFPGPGWSATFEASSTKGMLVVHRPALTRACPFRVSLGDPVQISLGGPMLGRLAGLRLGEVVMLQDRGCIRVSEKRHLRELGMGY